MTFSDFLSCLQPGDIIVTRNDEKTGNPTPGHWNHGSIYVGDGIVEARSSKGGVVKSDLREFFDRYPQLLVLRWREISRWQQATLAAAGNSLVGRGYWYLSSITNWLWRLIGKSGENCVSTPRRAYAQVLGIDFAWHVPDHIVEDPGFVRIAEKN